MEPGPGTAQQGVDAVAARHPAQPVAGRPHVREPAPAARAGVQQLHLADRSPGAEVLAAFKGLIETPVMMLA